MPTDAPVRRTVDAFARCIVGLAPPAPRLVSRHRACGTTLLPRGWNITGPGVHHVRSTGAACAVTSSGSAGVPALSVMRSPLPFSTPFGGARSICCSRRLRCGALDHTIGRATTARLPPLTSGTPSRPRSILQSSLHHRGVDHRRRPVSRP